MLLAYADESYTSKRYWITALICPETEVGPLSRALDRAVEDAADKFKGISDKAELHGHTLFHGLEDWEPLAPMVRLGSASTPTPSRRLRHEMWRS